MHLKTKPLAPLLVLTALTATAVVPEPSRAANTAEAFSYCREFIKSSPYSPTMNKFTDTFTLDADGGIHEKSGAIQSAKLTSSKSEIAMNLEGGNPPESMYTLRIEDQGGDPRQYLMNEMSLQTPPGGAPVVQTFDYTFVFNRGVCVPSRVVSTTGGTVRVLFDLDQCHALAQNARAQKGKKPASKSSTKSGDLDCSAWPQTAKILNDSRLSFAPIESSPNGSSSGSRGTR